MNLQAINNGFYSTSDSFPLTLTTPSSTTTNKLISRHLQAITEWKKRANFTDINDSDDQLIIVINKFKADILTALRDRPVLTLQKEILYYNGRAGNEFQSILNHLSAFLLSPNKVVSQEVSSLLLELENSASEIIRIFSHCYALQNCILIKILQASKSEFNEAFAILPLLSSHFVNNCCDESVKAKILGFAFSCCLEDCSDKNVNRSAVFLVETLGAERSSNFHSSTLHAKSKLSKILVSKISAITFRSSLVDHMTCLLLLNDDISKIASKENLDETIKIAFAFFFDQKSLSDQISTLQSLLALKRILKVLVNFKRSTLYCDSLDIKILFKKATSCINMITFRESAINLVNILQLSCELMRDFNVYLAEPLMSLNSWLNGFGCERLNCLQYISSCIDKVDSAECIKSVSLEVLNLFLSLDSFLCKQSVFLSFNIINEWLGSKRFRLGESELNSFGRILANLDADMSNHSAVIMIVYFLSVHYKECRALTRINLTALEDIVNKMLNLEDEKPLIWELAAINFLINTYKLQVKPVENMSFSENFNIISMQVTPIMFLLDSLKRSEENKASQVSSLQSTLTDQNTNIKRLQSENSESRAQSEQLQDRLMHASRQLQNASEDQELLQHKLYESNRNLQNCQSERNDLKAKNSALSSQVEKLTNEIGSLKSAHAETLSNIESKIKFVESRLNEERTSRDQERTLLSAKLSAAQNRIDEQQKLHSELESNRSQLSSLQLKAVELDNLCKDLKTKAAVEKVKWKRQLEEFQIEKSEQDNGIESLRSQISSEQRENQLLRLQISKLESLLNVKNVQIKKANEDFEKLINISGITASQLSQPRIALMNSSQTQLPSAQQPMKGVKNGNIEDDLSFWANVMSLSTERNDKM